MHREVQGEASANETPLIGRKGVNMQYLDYLHLRFDLVKARKLATGPKLMRLDKNWLPIPVLVTVEADYQDGLVPIVATLALNNAKTLIVIDGIAVAQRVIRQNREVPAVVLSLLNTINILTAKMDVKRRIKDQGKILGIL